MSTSWWCHPAPWTLWNPTNPARVGYTVLKALACCVSLCLAKQSSISSCPQTQAPYVYSAPWKKRLNFSNTSLSPSLSSHHSTLDLDLLLLFTSLSFPAFLSSLSSGSEKSPLFDTFSSFSSFSHFLSVYLKNLSCVPFLHVCAICGPS